MAKAQYRVLSITDDFIVIEDLDIGKSVTNDAEAVVKELVEKYGDHRIRYYDTRSELGELVHINGKFLDFLTICPTTDQMRLVMIDRHHRPEAYRLTGF